MLARFTTEANALRTIDPGLLEMHMIDGQVSRSSPLNVAAREFTATVSPPFKLKDGANVRLTDGESLADTTLQSLQFVGDNLNAVLDAPSSREGSAHQQGRRTKAPIRRITN